MSPSLCLLRIRPHINCGPRPILTFPLRYFSSLLTCLLSICLLILSLEPVLNSRHVRRGTERAGLARPVGPTRKYHSDEMAAVDRVAAEEERARHSPISSDDLRRYPNRWYGSDPLLYTLRLGNLRKKGYIDLPFTLNDDARKIDNDFHVPTAQSLPDTDPRYAYSRIHPVWRRGSWLANLVTREECTAITPALTLASCLLSEPTVLTFFTGLLEEVRSLDRPDVIEKYNNDPANQLKLDRLFHFNARLGPYDRQTLARTWRKLCDMRRYVRWGFDHLADDDYEDAATYEGRGHGFTEDRTTDSTITLSEDFLTGIRYVSELERRGYPVKVKVNGFWYLKTGTKFDQPSANMRRQFFLAVTMLYELAHAVWMSVHERFPDVDSSTGLGFEPFYGDQHVTELGFAFEQAIFGGKIQPSGPVDRRAICPYGLQIDDFPGLDDVNDLGDMTVALGSAKEHGIYYGRRSPIKAIDYLRYFKRRFWAMSIPRAGGKALIVPRHVAIRMVAKEDRADFDPDAEGLRAQALVQPWTSYDVLIADGWRHLRTLAYEKPKARGSRERPADDTEPADGGDDVPPTQRRRQDRPDDGGPSTKRQRQT